QASPRSRVLRISFPRWQDHRVHRLLRPGGAFRANREEGPSKIASSTQVWTITGRRETHGTGTPMDQVNLGRSGTRVSSIGTGTCQAGDDTWGPDVNDRDCIDAIVRASELGMGLVDTAENYGRGHSEEVLGR